MKYKKIKQFNRAGQRPVSIWVKSDPYRSFDEVIIGRGINEENIKMRRFDHAVDIVQSAVELRKAARKYDIKIDADTRVKMREYVRFV